MRIAQVAPLGLRIPPKRYGGIERVASYLTEALVCQGHDVTLFARSDAVTRARLIAPDDGASPPDQLGNLWAYYHLMLEQVYRHAEAFDAVHFHTGYRHFPLVRRAPLPHVTTMHWKMDTAELTPLFAEYQEMPLVSVSEAQREPLPRLNWLGTVYHGLPQALYAARYEPGQYLAFLGVLSPRKGAGEALEIARRAGMPLKLAGIVPDKYRDFFEAEVQPHLASPRVEYVGELNDKEKEAFLGNATALLCPIQFAEPFGLVMIEAMACGTPVIAYRRGAASEVVDDGVTGFVVEGLETAVEAVKQVNALNRTTCRQVFEHRFTARRMAEDYVAIYRQLAR